LKGFSILSTYPILIGLTLGILAYLSHYIRLELLAKVNWMLCGLWFYLIIFSGLPSYLLGRLERSVKVFDEIASVEIDEIDNILVFAAGYTNDSSLHANSQLSVTMLQRVVEGVRVYHKIGAKKLILSGPCKDERGCQAEVAAAVALSLLVPLENMAIITAGRNTIEELEAYIAEYGRESKLVAVSSAQHLKRIKLIADNLGLEVELSASDYKIKRENGRLNTFKPGFEGIGYTKMFLHEWLGMWYTRWYFFFGETRIESRETRWISVDENAAE
jgi:uncharacterized SAM-binding protein YcdF (DUF218 family)